MFDNGNIDMLPFRYSVVLLRCWVDGGQRRLHWEFPAAPPRMVFWSFFVYPGSACLYRHPRCVFPTTFFSRFVYCTQRNVFFLFTTSFHVFFCCLVFFLYRCRLCRQRFHLFFISFLCPSLRYFAARGWMAAKTPPLRVSSGTSSEWTTTFGWRRTA